MADNLAVTPGTGATVRTVDNAGVHLQAVALFDSTGTKPLAVDASGALSLSTADVADQRNDIAELLRVQKKILLVLQHIADFVVPDGAVDN